MGLSQDPDYATTLAFVQLNEQGDRDFSFYRNPGADTRLSFEDTDLSLIDGCQLLCFGSLLMTAEPSRTAVGEAGLLRQGAGEDHRLRPQLASPPVGRAGRKRAWPPWPA